jgi:hypothetical protein
VVVAAVAVVVGVVVGVAVVLAVGVRGDELRQQEAGAAAPQRGQHEQGQRHQRGDLPGGGVVQRRAVEVEGVALREREIHRDP